MPPLPTRMQAAEDAPANIAKDISFVRAPALSQIEEAVLNDVDEILSPARASTASAGEQRKKARLQACSVQRAANADAAFASAVSAPQGAWLGTCETRKMLCTKNCACYLQGAGVILLTRIRHSCVCSMVHGYIESTVNQGDGDGLRRRNDQVLRSGSR